MRYAANSRDALNNAGALIIVTEWEAFKCPDFNIIKARLKQPVIFDSRRNLFGPDDIKELGKD